MALAMPAMQIMTRNTQIQCKKLRMCRRTDKIWRIMCRYTCVTYRVTHNGNYAYFKYVVTDTTNSEIVYVPLSEATCFGSQSVLPVSMAMKDGVVTSSLLLEQSPHESRSCSSSLRSSFKLLAVPSPARSADGCWMG
jgi:hypothetical protein